MPDPRTATMRHTLADVETRLREIVRTADAAGRNELTAAERMEFNALEEHRDGLLDHLAVIEADERSNADAVAAFRTLASRPVEHRGMPESEIGEMFREAIRTKSLAPIDIRTENQRSGWSPGLERRTLSTSSGSGLRGTSFYDRLIRHMVEGSAVLAAGATMVDTETGEPLAVPKSSAFSSASIVSEGSAIGESDPTLGTVTLGAYKYAFLVQISYELANDNLFDLEGFLAEQTGVAIANAFGAHAINGTGTGQPRGILADATTGVTGGTGVTGAFTADNLIDLYHSLAEPYARSAGAAWLMRNSTLAAVRKLKDSQNRYMFDLQVPEGYPGASGMLLGRPVFVDPNVPAVGLGAKSVIFGDLSRYWVRQVNGVRFERSIDYAFGNDLITFRGAWRADGAMIDTTGALKVFAGGAS